MIATAAAFVRRDYLVWISYRLAAVWQLLTVGIVVAFLYFGGKTLGDNPPDFLADYETDYIGYLITSLAFVDVWTMSFLLPRTLREGQSNGTLEALVLSHYGVLRLLFLSASFPAILALLRFTAYAVIAAWLFGEWHDANPVSAAAVFFSAMLAMTCLGVLSSGFVLAIKQGDPVLAVYGLMNMVFAGVWFPREVLPVWLQPLSFVLPLSWGLDGIREALNGGSLGDVWIQVAALLGMSVVLIPLSAFVLRWSVRLAKKEGSLVQY